MTSNISTQGNTMIHDAGWHPLDAWRIFRRRAWPFLTVLGMTLLAAVLVTFRTTPEYRAVSSVLIERQTPRTGTLQDLAMLESYFNQDYYQTQYKIIQSRTLAERTMEKLALAARPEFKASSDPVATFLARLEVSPVRNSRIVNVAFEHPDGALAAQTVNALVMEYVGSSRVDLQACKLEYSIVSPK